MGITIKKNGETKQVGAEKIDMESAATESAAPVMQLKKPTAGMTPVTKKPKPVEAAVVEQEEDEVITAAEVIEHAKAIDESEVVKPVKIKTAQPTASVTKEYKDGTGTEENFTMAPVTVRSSALAEVGFSCGLTKNLGNYESMKFEVRIMIPCDPTAEEIEATYSAAKEWVDGKVTEINAEITEQLG